MTLTARLLVIVVVVLVVAIGAVLWSRSAAGEGSALHVSEAGVHYVLHLLNSGVCTPEELSGQSLVQTVPGTTDQRQGTFAVQTKRAVGEPASRFEVVSRGREGGIFSSCQAISADVEIFRGVLGTKYRVLSWEQRDTRWCGVALSPTTISCAGQGQP